MNLAKLMTEKQADYFLNHQILSHVPMTAKFPSPAKVADVLHRQFFSLSRLMLC